MAEGAEESEVGEKPWSDHKLYTDEFTTHFAVLLTQLLRAIVSYSSQAMWLKSGTRLSVGAQGHLEVQCL